MLRCISLILNTWVNFNYRAQRTKCYYLVLMCIASQRKKTICNRNYNSGIKITRRRFSSPSDFFLLNSGFRWSLLNRAVKAWTTGHRQHSCANDPSQWRRTSNLWICVSTAANSDINQTNIDNRPVPRKKKEKKKK